MKLNGLLARRNLAVLAAAAVVGSVGIGGVMNAQADNGDAPATNHSTTTDQGDGDGDGETNDDASDTGPDANPNEPGHQDASDATGGDGGDGETNDDATDTWPDANPNEPGHQDASDVPSASD